MKLDVVIFTVPAKNLKFGARNCSSTLYPSNSATIGSHLKCSFISAQLLGYLVECHNNN